MPAAHTDDPPKNPLGIQFATIIPPQGLILASVPSLISPTLSSIRVKSLEPSLLKWGIHSYIEVGYFIRVFNGEAPDERRCY